MNNVNHKNCLQPESRLESRNKYRKREAKKFFCHILSKFLDTSNVTEKNHQNTGEQGIKSQRDETNKELLTDSIFGHFSFI